MIIGFGNNVVSSLAADITASQTTIQVMPGAGAMFANLLTSDYANSSNPLKTYAKITLTDAKETVFEVCHLTTVNNDMLTVIRGQEGTTAKGWSLNDVIANFATRGSENQFVQIEELQSGHYVAGVAGGTENNLTLELPATYFVNGGADWTLRTPLVVIPALNNTGASTLQLTMGGRVLGIFPLYKGNKAELSANDIIKDAPVLCVLDNTKTYFSVLNPLEIYLGSRYLQKDQNLSDVPDKALARQSLQLGDSATRNVGTTANTVAAGDDSRITGAMQKDQNGADIPNKPLFLQNVGLKETINLAKNAVPATRRVNNKPLSGDITLSAADVRAISADAVGEITDNSTMASANTPGWWRVAVSNSDTVTDFPTYPDGSKLYSYGYLFVEKIGEVWFQHYYAHMGANAKRQDWGTVPNISRPWVIDYNTANKPSAGDVGALPITGGRLNGPLGIGTDNALGGNSIVFGDNDTGFKWHSDGVLGIYANNAQVGYIDNSGLHMLADIRATGVVRAGNGKTLTLSSGNNSALNAGFSLWGGGERPTVVELSDDQGWHLYSQRRPDGGIELSVNGNIYPSNYSNFDARYVQNIQRGAPVWPGKVDEYGPAEAPAGCFLTQARHDPTTAYGVTFAYRPLQMWVGNGWRTING
ncbi:hypothetical protein [Salmonella enterica]|uniref:hypothetical protein n=1 Tax=Salmonella enterica TaxID=28901 RepID=UPI001EFC32CE|nr:hypothetical protein [Salmonella enterica]